MTNFLSGLLTRVHSRFSCAWNFNDLAAHLLTLQIQNNPLTPSSPGLDELLTEGLRFSEAILDNQSVGALQLHQLITPTERFRLKVHVGLTRGGLVDLTEVCGLEAAVPENTSQLGLQEIVSSFLKYKVHLNLLMIYNCNWQSHMNFCTAWLCEFWRVHLFKLVSSKTFFNDLISLGDSKNISTKNWKPPPNVHKHSISPRTCLKWKLMLLWLSN